MEVITKFDKVLNIDEKLVSDLLITPNPASADVTISFELANATDMRVVLTDISGHELLVVYNDKHNAGAFLKIFSIKTLPTGVYYLKISHSGKNIRIEKIIKN